MVKDKSVRTVDIGVHGKVVVSDFEKTLSQDSKTGDVPDAEIPGLPRGWKRKIKNGRPVYVMGDGEERLEPPDGLYKVELLEGTTSSYVVKLAKGQDPPEYKHTAAHVETEQAGKAAETKGGDDDKKLAGFAFSSLFLRKLQHEALTVGQRRVAERRRIKAEKERLARSKELVAQEEQEGPKEIYAELTVDILEAIGFGHSLIGAEIDLGNASKVKLNMRYYDNGKYVNGVETTIRGRKLDPEMCTLGQTAKLVAMNPKDLLVVRIYAVKGGNRKKWWSSECEPVTEDMICRTELPVMHSLDQWEAMLGPLGDATDAKVHFRLHVRPKVAEADPTDKTGLPPGWVAHLTPEGRIFYVSEIDGTTQWEHPESRPMHLPRAWVKTTDAFGRVGFENIARSGMLGDPRNRVVYVNPAEPEVVRRTRGETVQLLLGLKALMAVDEEDETLQRANIEDTTRAHMDKITAAMVISDVEYKKFRGRFATFRCDEAAMPAAPPAAPLADPVLRWPHGLHKLGDRPWLLTALRQRDRAVERVRPWAPAAPAGQDPEQVLAGHIPLQESACFVRFGMDAPGKWDEQYLELSMNSTDAKADSHHLLLWGRLAATAEVRAGRRVVCVAHSVHADGLSFPMQRVDLSDTEFHAIVRQCSGALGGTVPLYALEFCTPALGKVTMAIPDQAQADAIVAAFPTTPDPDEDRVHCAFCGLYKSGWRLGMDPEQVHRRARPDCPYLAAWDGRVSPPPAARRPRGAAAAHARAARRGAEQVDAARLTRLPAHPAIARTSAHSAAGKRIMRATKSGRLVAAPPAPDGAPLGAAESPGGGEAAAGGGETLRLHRKVMHAVALGGAGDQLLQLAAAGDLPGVNRLLGLGVPVNYADGGLRTALHWAAAMGNTETCKLLILMGADVSAITAMGFTPRALARKGGFKALDTALQQAGAHV